MLRRFKIDVRYLSVKTKQAIVKRLGQLGYRSNGFNEGTVESMGFIWAHGHAKNTRLGWDYPSAAEKWDRLSTYKAVTLSDLILMEDAEEPKLLTDTDIVLARRMILQAKDAFERGRNQTIRGCSAASYFDAALRALRGRI